MPDNTYQPATYRKQGGNVFVIANGGELSVEDGGKITVPVVTETTAAALSNYGVSIVTRGTTGTGANTYTMDAPVAGALKILSVTAANSSDHVLVSGNTNVTYDPAGTKDKLKIVAPGAVVLVGQSTSAWQLVYASTVVAFATS